MFEKIKTEKCTWNFALDGGAIGTINLPIAFPTGTLITRAFVKIPTTIICGGAGTIALAVGGVTVQAATAYNSAPFLAGGATTLTSTLTSTAANLTLTVAAFALTAGVMDIIVEYVA
jgi:hypothetical protein